MLQFRTIKPENSLNSYPIQRRLFQVQQEDGKVIGQLELPIREYEGTRIGYVNLYCLILPVEEKAEGGITCYATEFFKSQASKQVSLLKAAF